VCSVRDPSRIINAVNSSDYRQVLAELLGAVLPSDLRDRKETVMRNREWKLEEPAIWRRQRASLLQLVAFIHVNALTADT
jgi:hypothetical protein